MLVNSELQRRDDEVRVEMMESLATFSKQVAEGKATPEQIEYIGETECPSFY